ncbi:MAG: hypothetical protein ABMB14_19235 [Myxococcota bacterium]
MPAAALDLVLGLAGPSSDALGLAERIAALVRPADRALAAARIGGVRGDVVAARAALADPTVPLKAVAVWAAVLPPDEVEARLVPWVARTPDVVDRCALVAAVPDPLAAQVLRAAIPDILDLPPFALDRAGWRARVLAEEARGDAFVPWRLGWCARDGPPVERASVLDRVIAGFDRIVGNPTSPGNDDGPLCDVAEWLTLSQLARAEAVLDRMSAVPGWVLDDARTALAWRRAALDPGYDPTTAPVSDGARDWLRGRLLAAHLTRGGSWIDPPAGTSVRLLDALVAHLSDPTDAVVEAAWTFAVGLSHEGADSVVYDLAKDWSAYGPVQRWLEVADTCDDQDRLDLLLALLPRDPRIAADLPPIPADRWPDLVSVARFVPHERFVDVFLAWTDRYRAPDGLVWWDWTHVPLRDGLVALTGPGAPRAALWAIAQWAA